MQDNLHKEVEHRVRVLKQNGYPATFICNASAPPTQETADKRDRKRRRDHWRRDQTETGDVTEGTPGCLREGDDGEVSYSGRTTTQPTGRRTQYWTMVEDRNCW